MLDATEVRRQTRQLEALALNVETNDPEAFAEMIRLLSLFDGLCRATARRMNAAEDGYSWAELAAPTHWSRETLYRWAHR